MQTDKDYFSMPRDIPLLMAAELQDSLMTATNDLERLQRLLDDAYSMLSDGFNETVQQLDGIMGSNEQASNQGLIQTRDSLQKAVTALQFQDMATQLIDHTSKRLRNCADQIARDAMGDDGDGMAFVEEGPTKPNPVTQDEMDAGSVELF